MSEHRNNIEETEEGLDMAEIILFFKKGISFLKTNLKVLLILGFIGAICGFYYAKTQKIKYSATLTFALEEDKASGGLSGGLSGIASQFGLDLGSSGGGLFVGANLFELMKSRLLIEKTLLNPTIYKGNEISIAEYYLRINGIRDSWDKKNIKIQLPVYLDRTKGTRVQDSVLNLIYSDLSSEKKLTIRQKDKKVTISTLEVLSEDEIFAKTFCENLAKITSEYYVEIKSKKARTNLEILQRQADSVRLQLNRAIIGYASSGDNVYNLNPSLNLKSSPTKQKQVDVQANTTILTQLLGNIELAKVTLRKETPLIQMIDQPIFPLSKVVTSLPLSVIIGILIAELLTLLTLIAISFIKTNLI
jgi:uncharacterized protein involved in exopolysaccharide biosynthesis